jgi:regulator of protease activity HflC (stomatin/prohibitin superfamily)
MSLPQQTVVVDRPAGFATSGYAPLILAIACLFLSAWLAKGFLLAGMHNGSSGLTVLAFFVAAITIFAGIYSLEPNQSAVLTLFGAYVGSDHAAGIRFTNPFYKVSKISRRIHNLECKTIKVNDLLGNPIEIAAVVVWRVADPAKARFQVEDYYQFVATQSESAIRRIAAKYPYDFHETPDAFESDPEKREFLSLRESGDEVMRELIEELRLRVANAGIEVDEARITHLAYAPEIAGAMLRRQQASAVLAARRLVVDGAVDIVDGALRKLADKSAIKLDDRQRAAMVANLLVVLVSDKDAAPVVNAGTSSV